jgi:hypothetical protein
VLVMLQQIIEGILSLLSALEWRACGLIHPGGMSRGAGYNGADCVRVRRLLRRAPRWKRGHQILRIIAEAQGDQELVSVCDEAIRRL